MDSTYLLQYTYSGITGEEYFPAFVGGEWVLIMFNSPENIRISNNITLSHLGKLCNIPEDELLMLKLRYGG